MRILALSDINWSINKRGTNLSELIALVEHVQPDLLLLAGDLVDNDKRHKGKPGLPYWRDLGDFFDYLESTQTRCLFVQGNWDEFPEYEELAVRDYAFVEEISGKVVNIDGLRVLGIPHSATTRLKTIRERIADQSEPVDVVLTHADAKQRVWLFDLPTKLIITGHFDNKMVFIRSILLLAFEHYPGEYAVIEYQPGAVRATYICGRFPHEGRRFDARMSENGFEWLSEKLPIQWISYAKRLEALIALKERMSELDADEQREQIRKLLAMGIFKTHIKEYIPGSASLLP